MREVSQAHRDHLRTSGLDDETIALNGLFTSNDPKELCALLKWESSRASQWPLGACLAIPMIVPGETRAYAHRVRPDTPLRADNGKPRKYESPKRGGVPVFFPARARERGWFEEVERVLVWTEGEKKAMLLDQLGYACVGLTGVWNAHDPVTKKGGDGFVLRPLISEHVRVAGRKHLICFDNGLGDGVVLDRSGRPRRHRACSHAPQRPTCVH